MGTIIEQNSILLKKVQTEFVLGLNAQKTSNLDPIISTVNLNGAKIGRYPIFEHQPQIKQWIDNINYGEGKIFEYSVESKEYAIGLVEDRFNLEYSMGTLSGSLKTQINTQIQQWTNFKDKMVNDLIAGGASGTAFDGTAFFSATRPNIKSAAALNNIATGTGTSLSQLRADLNTAISQLYGFKDINGYTFNQAGGRLAIVCPRHLYFLFQEIVNPMMIVSDGSQIFSGFKGIADVVVNDLQSQADNDWYLVNTGNTFKPFIYQISVNPKFGLKDEEDNRFIKFFSTASMGANYGNPLAIIKVNN